MESRSKKIARNAIVSLACQVVTIVLGFVCRKALIVSLGLAYVGANSLFSSIISLLSFVELGIGNAIIFSLYKPIANNDKESISAYISYFEKIYTIVAIAVILLGGIVTPFLTKIVDVEEGITENIYAMYFLTLIATACTYLFAARRTLLIADQKQYIEKIIYQISHIGQVLTQVIVLFVFKDYYLFLIAQIVFALLNNIIATIFVNRNYPYIKNKDFLPKEKRENLFTDIRAMFLYKVGSSLLNYVSNIFISYYCGLVFLGKVANYTLVLGTLTGIVTQLNSALSASVGNKNTVDSKSETQGTFRLSLFLMTWITGFFLVSFLTLSTPFLSIMYGKDVVINDFMIIASIGVLYYVQDTHAVSATYRYSMGVFRQGRYVPLLAAILNIGLMIFLYHIIGIPGLYIATIIARILTLGIADSYLILGGIKGTIQYFKECTIYFAVIIILFFASNYTIQFFSVESVIRWLISAFLVTIIYNAGWIIVFHKSSVFKELVGYVRVLLKR